MPVESRLNSVCHSIAHHAISGLSYLLPHLGAELRDSSQSRIEINLLSDSLPPILLPKEPLVLAVKALRRKFEDMLESEGFTIAEIEIATLNFDFSNSNSDYLAECDSVLVTINGKRFHHSVRH